MSEVSVYCSTRPRCLVGLIFEPPSLVNHSVIHLLGCYLLGNCTAPSLKEIIEIGTVFTVILI